jgi:hypothetical protein
MSAVYEAVGRAVIMFVRHRFRTQIRIALGVGLGSLLLGGYLALSREVKEG